MAYRLALIGALVFAAPAVLASSAGAAVTSEAALEAGPIAPVCKLQGQTGAAVVAVGLNDSNWHAEFAAEYHVPFPLLADAGGQVASQYGVPNRLFGISFAKTVTFLIDSQGRIAMIYRDVDRQQQAARVLSDLSRLRASA